MKKLSVALAIALGVGCASVDQVSQEAPTTEEDLFVVDCLLPAKVKQLGTSAKYLSARQPIKTTASDCAIRGGEYTAYDRADYATSLKIWLPQAQAGDAEAQVYVGEIYEKGLGLEPDYDLAAVWYKKAAKQGFTRAQINLGNLYEKGLGVEQDSVKALNWYRAASGVGSDKLQYSSTIVATQSLQSEVDKLASENEQLKAYKEKNEAALAKKKRELEEQAKQAAEQVVAQVEPKFNPPSIQIIDPPISLTRSGPSALLRSATSEREVIGKVDAPAGVSTFVVNGSEVALDEFNLFFLNVPIESRRTLVSMSAMDQVKQAVDFDFTLFVESGVSAPSSSQTLTPSAGQNVSSDGFGKFYALVIGNNDYSNYVDLKTPITDAKAVANLLSQRYGFETKLLLNVDRYELLTSINELRSQLTEEDNLLIYYAGHGDLDAENERGYWLPVDAEPDNSATWLSNTAISDQLNLMKARHVLVVADSCYAGTLSTASVARQNLNLSDADIESWLDVMKDVRARTVLTSGGVRPVLDSGGGQHSIFAKAFLETLGGNNRVLDGNSLFVSILGDVKRGSEALAHEQIPDYGAIKYAGHEAGEFFLFPQLN